MVVASRKNLEDETTVHHKFSHVTGGVTPYGTVLLFEACAGRVGSVPRVSVVLSSCS